MESNYQIIRKVNPRLKTNVIFRLLFLHMIPIFWRNYKKGLKEEDLYDVLEEHKSSTLGDALENAWLKARKTHPKHALHWALLKVYWPQLVITGFFRYLMELILIGALPFSINKLVSYFEKGSPAVSKQEAYIYAGVIVITLLVDSLISHPVMLWLMHMAMKMRVSCCSLIYRKSLRLSKTALGETTIGQVVNLLSNDVRKFDEGLVICHFMWIAPLQIILGTYLLYDVIGLSAFAGIGFLIIFIPIQVYLAKYNSTIRLRTALRTDERVRLMNEILSGIQVIKMYAWEKPFAALVALARKYEIKETRIHYYIESVIYAMGMLITRTSIFISIVVYVYLGNNITADVAYSITATYSVLRPIVTLIFSFSIISVAEIHISVIRLQQFLNYDELSNSGNDYRDLIELKPLEKNGSIEKVIEKEGIFTTPKVTFKNVCVKWVPTANQYDLSDINLNIEDKKLVAVIGTVGSGKSTLLNVILREVPVSTGSLDIYGEVSYASQEPWLFAASIRQNILFGNEYDESRYKSVIRVCALETDLRMFPHGDRTIVSEKGKSLSGGQKARINLARCVYKHADIYLLDDPLSAVDTRVGKQLYNNCIKKFLSDKICILITHQLQYLKTADKIVIMEEGKIAADGGFDELQHSGLDFANMLRQFQDAEQENAEIIAVRSRQNLEIEYEEEDNEIDENKEIVATGGIGFSTYMQYFRAGGALIVIILLVLVIIGAHAAGRGGDYFVSYWVNLEQAHMEQHLSNSTFNRDPMIYTYSGIILGTVILAIACPVFFFVFFMRASINIHDTMFRKISYATMKFFNDNPTGRILNRFSKDIGIIDEYIPFILLDVTDICFVFIGSMTLSAMVNPYLLLPSAVLVGIFYIVRIFYLHTSRSVKRIEGITRTPIFNHLTASMNGLSTIRAFKAERILINEFDVHQDLHSSSWYLFISANRAFGFFLDLICSTFICIILYSLIVLNKGYYGGDVGLVVTQMISLSGLLQWGMRQWTELENNMTSVERVIEYTKPESEPVREPIANLPKQWPEFGKIIFINVSMRYKPNDAPILKNLNFTILPREKIGIVGRTGAGKTSTIAALFQLYEIEGSIIVDDVDTTKLPLEILRPKISIIPQEPVLFSGTLRKNLDPFEEYGDDTLWNALEQVELKEVIEDSPGGLNTNVTECGANYSVGQRQLVCLARALIRNNKILVMDEATANVDPHTDSLIQKTIRRGFADCTVLTIAHRLHTIMDSDRVLVMDRGELVEFDHPHNLLQKTNSIFYSMAQTTGSSAIQKLKSIAEESYTKSKP